MRAVAELAGDPGRIRGFSQSVVAVVPAGAELGLLVQAVAAVIDRHDALRARLETAAHGRWQLRVGPAGSVDAAGLVRRADARGLDGRALDEAVGGHARDAAGRLDPTAGVMVQAVWCDAGPGRPGRLVLTVHHLVVDGVSWRVILPDLATAYEAVAAGRRAVLEPAGTSFRRWARMLAGQAGEAGRAAELGAWERMLGQRSARLGDRPLDAGQDTSASMRRVSVTVPVPVGAALLSTVPAAFHAGVDDVLLAGLAAAVAQWQGRRGRRDTAVLVDLEGHGRVPLAAGMDLSRTVGWFTSVCPVWLDAGRAGLAEIAAGGPAAGQLIKRVKEQIRAIPGDGLGHGLLRHLNPATAPVLAALEAPQIGFNYLGRYTAGGGAGNGSGNGGGGAGYWQPVPVGVAGGSALPAAHVIEAISVARDRPGGPEFTLTVAWPAGLLSERDAGKLAAGWLEMITGLAGHAAQPAAGGHTPSDFPLAEISQDDIEDLEDEFADDVSERRAR
jgi:nonribosomal peptide synthetase CepB